jgi:hypothetical protein
MVRYINESLSLVEFDGGRFARDLVRMITESLSVSEGLEKTLILVKYITESVSLVEFEGKYRNLLRIINESLHISEIAQKIRWAVVRVVRTHSVSSTTNDAKLSLNETDASLTDTEGTTKGDSR